MKKYAFSFWLLAVLTGVISAGPARAADDAAAVSSAETVEGKVYQANNLDALKELVGQPVTVEGTVVEAGTSGSGTVRYLNFSKPFWKSVAFVFFTESTTFPVETLETYVGKRIKGTGKLSEHNTKLQIAIETPDQIEVVEDEAVAETPAAE